MGDCYPYPNVNLFGKTSCLCSRRACTGGVSGDSHGSLDREQSLSPPLSRFKDKTRGADADFPHNQNLKPQVFVELSFLLPFCLSERVGTQTVR